jgi:hypothetical protein
VKNTATSQHFDAVESNYEPPVLSRPETKRHFYFLARPFTDAGSGAIHYGQVEIMNDNDAALGATR